MGVKERLKAFVAYMNISEREFCRTIGVSVSYIASIRRTIKADKLQIITEKYPQLNTVWLIRGEGNMLLNVPNLEQENAATPAVGSPELTTTSALLKLLEAEKEEKARLLNLIESQQRTIETLAESSKKAVAQPGEAAGCAAVG